MAQCRAGFPGCARMDDITGCPEFGAMQELDGVQAQRDALAKAAEPFVEAIKRRSLPAVGDDEYCTVTLSVGEWRALAAAADMSAPDV